eukprot:GHRR01008685.1.p1 GENE.GHRR01008685.1~~GHRR01008685.1.p1  ORF type:complete len:415 (+),score=133.96 GHRR01008685.1:211-1455(+)
MPFQAPCCSKGEAILAPAAKKPRVQSKPAASAQHTVSCRRNSTELGAAAPSGLHQASPRRLQVPAGAADAAEVQQINNSQQLLQQSLHGTNVGPGSTAGTPSASCVKDDFDENSREHWWLPQPHPSLHEDHCERRPAAPLAEALQCKICQDLLKEAITAPECGHSFCYSCIDDHVTIGGKANVCPICRVLFGPNPFEHKKLLYDFTLDSLVRKVFPRPLLDAALESRRLNREEAIRQAKANLTRRGPRMGLTQSSSSGQLVAGFGSKTSASLAAATGPQVELALFPWPPLKKDGSKDTCQEGSMPTLPRPYMRAPVGLTIAALKSWLCDRLVGKKADASRLPNLQLVCEGQVLELDMTLQQVHKHVWEGRNNGLQDEDKQGQGPSRKGIAAAAHEMSATAIACEDKIMLLYYKE